MTRRASDNEARKIYRGERCKDGVSVTWHRRGAADTPAQALALRLDLCRHSPTGFEWGYNGSGPAQLALALLADALQDDDRALMLYQRFKEEVVAYLPHRAWFLSDVEVQRLARRIEAEQAVPAALMPIP